MPDYLKVDDFLTYDGQMTKRIARVDDKVDAVREQVNRLNTTLIAYIAETDTYRNKTNKRLSTIESELADVKHVVSTLAQTISQSFAIIFAHLGIQS